MAGYVELEVTTDPQELTDQALDSIAGKFPGWTANEAHLEVALVEENARMNAETQQVAADVAAAIFRVAFGQKLMGLAPIDGNPAGALTTWTAIDNAGYTIPQGTVIAFRRTGDELVLFETMAEAVIPAGQLVVANVPIAALEVGTEANGIAAGPFELIDAISFIVTVASTTVTSGGVDAETDEEYGDRLADALTLLTPQPIRAPEFALLARNTEGVHRATAIDGFNPADQTLNNERMVAVAAVDAAGNPVSADVKALLDADLQAKREVNFIVHVIDPTYTDLDIVFQVQAKPTFDLAQVEAAAEQAVKDYIDPAKWAGGGAKPPRWDRETMVRYSELIQVINSVPGVAHITETGGLLDLTINGARASVVLAGQAPLPLSIAGGSSVNGTVVAP